MGKISEHLVKLSDQLDKQGKTKCADAIDELIGNQSLLKVAQYVGVIGYVLKQNRAMSNCVRKKRATSNTSMQEVVLSCLKEYQDGQQYSNDEWTSKYAEVVNKEPESFEISHLNFLASLSNESNIDKDIENVEKVANILKEEEVEDELFKSILSHLGTYGDILRKEATSHVNFRLAAPPSQRGWSSRILNPSEFKWYNPLSWNKDRRMRGEDKDTILEMDNVLEQVMDITDKSQQARTLIYRLQSQSGTFPSHISEPIKKLNADDWSSSIESIQELQRAIRNSQMYTQHKDVELASNLVNMLSQGIDSIYDSIREIQINMNMLRQRAPIRGRYMKPDSRAASSPANEFGALERVLNKLYQNPFDQQAHYYAQRMHSRLDDKLRYIEHAPDEESEEWSRTTFPPPATEEMASEPYGEPEVPTETVEFSEEKVKALAESILSIPVSADPNAKSEFVARVLNDIFNTSGLNIPNNVRDLATRLRDLLVEKSRESNVESMPIQASLDNLIKVADIMDTVDKDLADLIDEYTKQHKSSFDLPEFPETAEMLKDKGNEELIGQ